MELEIFIKIGCKNNQRQVTLLEQAGIKLIQHDILTYPWNPWELLPFFDHLPITQWFNPSAPLIKEGKVRPDCLTPPEAIKWMIKAPLLIRRPLIRYRQKHIAGFDPVVLEERLGLPLSALALDYNAAKFEQVYVACREDRPCP